MLFLAVMAVVLLAMGGFVYERVGSSLGSSLNSDLRVRADDVSAPKDGKRGDARDFGGAEGVAQLLAHSGAVLRGTPALAGRSLLTPAELAAARLGPIFIDRAAPPAFGDGRWRVLAEPVSQRPNAEIAVVAASPAPARGYRTTCSRSCCWPASLRSASRRARATRSPPRRCVPSRR